MPQRVCIDCARLFIPGPTSKARCPTCQRTQDRATLAAKRTRRPHIHAEDLRRAATVAQHKATYGDWCPGWGRPPHPATDLTAEHSHAVAAGGDETQPLTVLCRSCNSSKGHRR